MFWSSALAAVLFLLQSHAQTIINGQILTPGIAIIDAPQPNTPLGGDFLQVALDVSSDGQLQLPPYPANALTRIYNITLFLTSYDTGENFTISNSTHVSSIPNSGDIMKQEPGSTVKHVNWIWPDCLVGDGPPMGPKAKTGTTLSASSLADHTGLQADPFQAPPKARSVSDAAALALRTDLSTGSSSARGRYNISIHQNFRINGTDRYTIFDLPIQVVNDITGQTDRPSCNAINNTLISPQDLLSSADQFTRIAGSPLQNDETQGGGSGPGIGNDKPDAGPKSGLGAAGSIDWKDASHWVWIAGLFFLA